MRNAYLLAVVGALAAAPLFASPPYSYVGRPDALVYLGHVAECDLRSEEKNAKVLREGREEGELAVPNTPLLPGDTIVTESGGRCEVQLDTGTVLRLDGGTRLKLETILAPSLSTPALLTNLVLDEGSVHILYRDYGPQEVFQVLTPNAAIKLRRAAAATVHRAGEATAVETDRGSVDVLFGPAAKRARKQKVEAGHRLVVTGDHAAGPGSAAPGAELAAFLDWNRTRDTRLAGSPRDTTPLPKGLHGSPPAVLDFANRWSNEWGTWVWSDVYGSVWRPTDNGRSDWRPYANGRWTEAGGEPFWVPEEPWGWVPYHLGYWMWLRQQGWVWVPGSLFAPDWVRWVATEAARPWEFLPFEIQVADGQAGPSTGGPPAPDRPPDHAIPRKPPPRGPEPQPSPEQPTRRLHDFNPDARAARGLGGVIHYSSRDNAIRCEGCRSLLSRSGGDSHQGVGNSGVASSSTGAAASGTSPASVAPPATPGPAAAGAAGGRESGARREN
jgi:hypothetical protein